MSKASNYAKGISAPQIDLEDYSFKVDNDGDLSIDSGYSLTSGAALELGVWLIDTFGESEKEVTGPSISVHGLVACIDSDGHTKITRVGDVKDGYYFALESLQEILDWARTQPGAK